MVRSTRGLNMAIRSTQGRNRAARSTQGGVTLMVMDCGACFIFIRFRIPDQVYCNKSQKNNNYNIIITNICPLPFTQTWDCLALCFHVNVSVFVKEDKWLCEWKPRTQHATKYIIMFSKLSTYTHQIFRSTSMQEASTLLGKGIRRLHVYQCEREKCISYIVNENIKYATQYNI